jgi:hypothetical protein
MFVPQVTDWIVQSHSLFCLACKLPQIGIWMRIIVLDSNTFHFVIVCKFYLLKCVYRFCKGKYSALFPLLFVRQNYIWSLNLKKSPIKFFTISDLLTKSMFQWLIAQLVESSLLVMKDPGSNLGANISSFCYWSVI